jgi:2-polyprenyl-3-methyl-5-hydroxy-6-metoxy-1,4-benzoquinol methylase
MGYDRIDSILDIGCGIGMVPLIWNLQNTSTQYEGIDVVPEYVNEARSLNRYYNTASFTCAEFMEYPIRKSYHITIALGTFAFVTEGQAIPILMKAWELTRPGGALAFSFLPDSPLPRPAVRWLANEWTTKETLYYTGYAKSGEEIAIFRKRLAMSVPHPPLHEEELEQEVLMGEHREDEQEEE